MPAAMLAIERRRAILDRLARDGRVVVVELAPALAVTEETIRRDLNQMERSGLLSRTHGGAVPRPSKPEDLPYTVRDVTNIAAKRRIGAIAAELLPAGASVMLDSSSTAREALRAAGGQRDLTIITNSVRLLSDPDAAAHTVISVGGDLRHRAMTFVGPLACQSAAQFNADFALLSCKAVSLLAGVMDANLEDAAVKRVYIAQAARVVLLADASKLDRTALVTIADLARIDVLVTERRPAEVWCERLAAAGVELLHG